MSRCGRPHPHDALGTDLALSPTPDAGSMSVGRCHDVGPAQTRGPCLGSRPTPLSGTARAPPVQERRAGSRRAPVPIRSCAWLSCAPAASAGSRSSGPAPSSAGPITPGRTGTSSSPPGSCRPDSERVDVRVDVRECGSRNSWARCLRIKRTGVRTRYVCIGVGEGCPGRVGSWIRTRVCIRCGPGRRGRVRADGARWPAKNK